LALHDDVEISRLIGLLAERGVEIDEIRKDEASLEEVFVNLVEGDPS